MSFDLSGPVAAGIVAVGFAPFAGSFLGVVVKRLPEGRPIVLSRSACAACGTKLGPRDLVPLLSFAASRGRCRHCGAAIPGFHPAIELAATLVALIAAFVMDSPEGIAAACGLGWALLCAAWIDWEHYILPDIIVLPLLLAGLAVNWLRIDDLPADAALGAAVGYSAFAGLAWAYRRLRGHDGLGMGDAKLLAAGGAWLGWEALPAVVLIAAGIGLGAAGIGWFAGRRVTRMTRLPFGPSLALAIWAVFLLQG